MARLPAHASVLRVSWGLIILYLFFLFSCNKANVLQFDVFKKGKLFVLKAAR